MYIIDIVNDGKLSMSFVNRRKHAIYELVWVTYRSRHLDGALQVIETISGNIFMNLCDPSPVYSTITTPPLDLRTRI